MISTIYARDGTAAIYASSTTLLSPVLTHASLVSMEKILTVIVAYE